MSKKQDEIKVMSAEQAEKETADLPDPGYERSEELKRRVDELEAALAALQAQKEVYSVNPSVLREDREILGKMNLLEVTNAQPGRTYKWVYYGLNGQMVMKMKYFGWRVVGSDDPECPEMREADNTRRIGDTLLMWIPVERYEELEERSERVRLAQQKGVEAALKELGDRYRDKGIKVVDPEQLAYGKPDSDQTVMDRLKKRAAAKAQSGRVNQMLKSGTVPGMPAPGEGGR